ncbi:HlyD family type I secretion periplasmic adaptor subunit [Endozoicomonas euniceicola]|uniref:Membrane fusion protein (MFP) family protein n=1 Tax=Endozoicomonas euniceicola TaxID=1234143 RepID=A0ABY6GZB7_9GAMM|nr:HlyD family type I secretion periplasmic adaptor subunit [Endozoicomonas euniceicola]UYM17724.1 HlyD family type I secretion periplasmic adaptor subunit [Endozoicomonas euniceicola]
MFAFLSQKILAITENDTVQQKTRRQFLPAALEVEETPAHPAGRVVALVIGLLFIIGVIWACVGKIDIVAIAQGRIIPGERVKTIQPIMTGEVKIIHVKEGDEVKKGQRLVTFDTTLTKAELTRVSKEIAALSLQLAREEAFTYFLDNPSEPLPKIKQILTENFYLKKVEDHDLNFECRLLEQQIIDHLAVQKTMLSQLKSKQSEKMSIHAIVSKLKRVLPIVSERTKALEGLYKKNYGSRVQYLELKQQQIETEEDITAQEAALQRLQAEEEQVRNELNRMHAQVREESLDQQGQLHRQLAGLEQERIKANERFEQQILRSPIDGTVQQLQTHTVGGVFEPAQKLMQIVPSQATMEVEAWVLNKDVGFVQEGQTAEVKIDTFNFTKYGLLSGFLATLSNDAVPDEKLGLRYLANIQIEKDWMQVGNRQVDLSPGMTVTVEIKTGQRRLIEYFLSPLLRFKQESVRER